MVVSLEVPDELARALSARNGADLPQSLLEMIALEGYRSEQLTHAEVMSLLGFEHPLQVEQFLKDHGVSLDYTVEDMEHDRAVLQKLGR